LVKTTTVRTTTQTLSFIGINLGFLGLQTGIPLAILSCQFLKYRVFDCFFYVLQDGLATGFQGGTLYLYTFAIFIVLFVLMALLLGTAWCAWICPVGYVQDLLSKGRAKAGIGYFRIPDRYQRYVKPIKYVFLVAVLIISLGVALPWISNTKIRNSLYLPLCYVCPARALFVYLQIFVGILPPTTDVPLLSIIALPIFLVGALVVRRGWCIICPNLALLSFFHKLNAVSLFRRKVRCTKCGTCSRVCAMGAADQETQGDVSKPECIRCFDCIDHCPADKSRSAYFFKKKILESEFSEVALAKQQELVEA
jgi:ferredoxin-type protein NapH